MKNLNKAYYTAYNQLTAIGIELGFIDDITINTRAKRRWGLCTYHYDTNNFTIQISNRLLDDNVDDMALYNTLIHEMLHTCENCMNHGKEWQRLADIVNKTYGYNIKRTTSSAEKGLENIPSSEIYHYYIHCENCNRVFKYKRNCKIVNLCKNGNAKCPCGSKSFWVEHV